MNEQAQKEIDHYKRILAICEHDLSYKGYLSFVKIIKQQVEYLESFDLKTRITESKKDSSEYERAESIIDKLPKKISELKALQSELKIEFDPEEGKVKRGPISPQTLKY